MNDKTFEFEIHFPYNKIVLENLTNQDVETIEGLIFRGHPFHWLVKPKYGEDKQYLINPPMVTFAELRTHLPF